MKVNHPRKVNNATPYPGHQEKRVIQRDIYSSDVQRKDVTSSSIQVPEVSSSALPIQRVPVENTAFSSPSADCPSVPADVNLASQQAITVKSLIAELPSTLRKHPTEVNLAAPELYSPLSQGQSVIEGHLPLVKQQCSSCSPADDHFPCGQRIQVSEPAPSCGSLNITPVNNVHTFVSPPAFKLSPPQSLPRVKEEVPSCQFDAQLPECQQVQQHQQLLPTEEPQVCQLNAKQLQSCQLQQCKKPEAKKMSSDTANEEQEESSVPGIPLFLTEDCYFSNPWFAQQLPTSIRGPFPDTSICLILPRMDRLPATVTLTAGLVRITDSSQLLIPGFSTVPCVLTKGLEIARLYLLTSTPTAPVDSLPPQAAMALIKITEERPHLVLEMGGRKIKGLLDTGADVTVIARKDWPDQWATTVTQEVFGVGGFEPAHQSVHPITFQSDSGSMVQLRPLVMDVPITLWGRDLLSKARTVVHTHF